MSGHPLLQGLLLSLLLGGIAVGQSAESAPPSTIQFAPLDLEAIAAEDGERDAFGFAPRFAIPQEVSLTPGNSGVWSKVDERLASWQLRISCENAISFNFGFIRWSLPYGAEMRILNAAGTQKIRPFDIYDVQEHGELWTPAIGGNGAIIQINCLHEDRWIVESAVMLGFVNIGYRGFHAKEAAGGGASPFMSGSCNVDVACPQSAGWENEIDCVGVISTGGSTFCTGFMVNNTNQDGTPYFMTADHCGITSGNAASLVVYWNYENSFCRTPGSAASGGPGDGVLNQFSTGSIFRAGSGVSDFTLVELNAPPNPAFGVSFCGWNNGAIPTTGAVGIHHPNTDEKRISFEDQPVVLSGNYVDVTDWDLGTTEPGSSGSPLFDMNHRVIGQLCCGAAACGNNLGDSYGWFGTSWGLGLSGWLDPTGSGATVLDTLPAGGGGPVELCSNGIDDDGDSLVDCNDPDCATSPACLPPEPGDECAIALIATLGSNPIDTTLMTPSTDPFNNAQCASTFLGAMHNDVWYALTAPNSGDLSVSTCGTVNFDTDIVVYSGACGALVQIGCNGDGPSASCPGFSSDLSGVPVTAGATYYIRIGGYDGSSLGTGTVDISVTGGPGPSPENCTNGIDDDGDGAVDCADPDCASNPACGGGGTPGDECSSALIASVGSNPIDTTLMTPSTDPFNNAQCASTFLGAMHNDVWYALTAPNSGDLSVSTCGTVNFDTDIVVYSGACGALVQIGCNGDGPSASCPGFSSDLSGVPVTAGATYYIRIGGYDGSSLGTGTVDITVTGGPGPGPENCTNGVDDDGDGAVDCADPDCAGNPACGGGGVPGDECANALVATLGPNPIDNFGASTSVTPVTGCTGGFGDMANDLWWTFTAGSSGVHTVSTCGTVSFDTDLEVYAGPCGALSPVGCSGDTAGCAGFTSVAEFNATAGVTYRIRIGGWSPTEIGSGTFDISTSAPPVPENCTNGVDDDGDGAVDCADPDCASDPICAPPPALLWTFSVPGATVGFPQGSGVAAFSTSISIEEASTNTNFPNETQGFSLGLENDPALLTATALDLAPALAGLDGGNGPAFLSLDLYANGVTAGVIYDFFGLISLNFAGSTEVLTVDYSTVAGSLAGSPNAVTTSLTFSDSVGAPAVETVMVVDGANYGPAYSNAVISLEPQPFLFTFLAPALTVDYPAATGVTSFTAPFSIEEDPANNGFPNATQGFSMGIAHDASLLDATAITPLPALAALDSGSGPAFLDLDLYSTGVTVGVVYDFFGVETLSFSSATEVIEVGYTTQGGTLAGAIDPTVTSILWSNSIGSPPVESVLVVAASSVTPSYSNGSITLVPGVGGFRRMDCNVDGSTDIADAIAALSALFSGGTVTCDDACDVNDDGSFDIADAIAALSVLFSGAPNPPAPYGDCGADPTSDTLECDTYNAC